MMAKTIYRLECNECSASVDGVRRIPKGWKGVYRIQSLRESRRDSRRDGVKVDLLAWQTHMGWCPNCAEEYREEWDDTF